MGFYTQNGQKRPVRLSEETRRFAHDSLDRRYGLETLACPAVELDGVEGIKEMTWLEKYDVAIRAIAERAPIRICEGERISGAATLGLAIKHRVPATLGGAPIMGSISHLTIDFETVLTKGIDHIRAKAEEHLRTCAPEDARRPFWRSCVCCLDAFDIWHGRYLEALAGRPEYADNYRALLRVPHKGATSFYEAVQSLWFTFAFVRLCGNWPGIGRIDVLLGDYLKRDLASGIITLDDAREMLAHFFIKGCEWICGPESFSNGSGDAQHYQNIVLGGVDEKGNDVTNEVTYLVLDILEETGIGDFPTTVRLNKHTDEHLLRRVAEVMRLGGGILAVYNEDVVLDALVADGYPLNEARTFANDGCWEVQIPGKTYFSYLPFDSLWILQHRTLEGYAEGVDFDSFEALYQAYVTDLAASVEEILTNKARTLGVRDGETGAWRWKPQTPCTVVSLFEQGCIEKGRSYLEGGPIYNISAPHIGGLADTVNSLYAIRRLVFEEGKVTLAALLDILRRDWEGEERLRQYAFHRYTYYGNDSDDVDAIAARLLSDFADICKRFDGRWGFRCPSGVSTFGRQLEWAPKRLASPHGKHAHEVLAANASPTPGTDHEGATAIIRSYCKVDYTKHATGAALDIRLLPTSVRDEAGLQGLVSLLRGFVELGGFFMQPDVVDAAILREAQAHPEQYGTLSVRVSGWNARFVTLNRDWQDMVIAQNEK